MCHQIFQGYGAPVICILPTMYICVFCPKLLYFQNISYLILSFILPGLYKYYLCTYIIFVYILPCLYVTYLIFVYSLSLYISYLFTYLIFVHILSLYISCLVCMNIIFLHMLFCIYLALFVLNLSYLCILSACLVCRNVSTSRRSSHCSSRDMTYSSHLFTVFVHNNT